MSLPRKWQLMERSERRKLRAERDGGRRGGVEVERERLVVSESAAQVAAHGTRRRIKRVERHSMESPDTFPAHAGRIPPST